MRKTKIALFGSYSGYNKGDLSILVAMLKHLLQKQKDFQVLIPSKKPFALKKMLPEYAKNEISIYKTLTPCWGLYTLKNIKASDFLVFGGGGLFFDQKLYNIFSNHLLNLFCIVLLNNYLFKKPVYIFSVGASHLSSKIALFMTKFILNSADRVTVRDHYTKELFAKYCNSKVNLYYDPGFLLNAKKESVSSVEKFQNNLNAEPNFEQKILFVLSNSFLSRLNNNLEMSELINLINRLQGRYRVVLSYNTTASNLIRKLYNRCIQESLSLFHPRDLTPEEFISFFKIFDFSVCVPMHAAIFSYNAGVKMITVEHDHKIRAFNRIVGNENSVEVEQLSKIPRYIDNYRDINWGKKKHIRANALDNILKLKEFSDDLKFEKK